jgi:hypothetical protein
MGSLHFRSPLRLRLALPLLLVLLTLCACSNRPSIAARATVETFYSALRADNLPLADDNTAQSASTSFRDHAQAAAEAAQSDDSAAKAVEVMRVDSPAINGDTAQVHVVFADGSTDVVSLTKEGPRWKVLTSGRLG